MARLSVNGSGGRLEIIMSLLVSNPANPCQCAGGPQGPCNNYQIIGPSRDGFTDTFSPMALTSPPSNCTPTIGFGMDTGSGGTPAIIIEIDPPGDNSFTYEYTIQYEGTTIDVEDGVVTSSGDQQIEVLLFLTNPVWNYQTSPYAGYIMNYNGFASNNPTPQVIATLSVTPANPVGISLGTSPVVIFYEGN